MNYQKIYNQLIEKRQQNILTKNKNDPNWIYNERHHIIPKCLGGTDDKSNLVNLTAREHFIAHYLLWKIHPCDGILLAFYMFKKGNNDSCVKRNFKNSRLYESARLAYHEWNVRAHTGKKQSPEQIANRVKKNTGKKRTEEQKRNISEGRKKSPKVRGHIPWNKGLLSSNTIKRQTEKAIRMEKRAKRHAEILEEQKQKEIRKQKRLEKQKEKELKKQERHNNFVLLKKQRRHKRKLKENKLKKSKLKWWNNGIINTRSFNSPGIEWKRGRI